MRVFLSHTSDPGDLAFTRRIAEFLKAIKAPRIDVWFDEENLQRVGPLDDALRDAIGKSDYGVFVVSRALDAHNYPSWELEHFVRKDPTLSRLIVILRAPRVLLEIPSPLHRVVGLDWFDEDDTDAKVYELYCAITGTERGPAAKYAELGRAIRGLGASADVPVAPSPSAKALPAFQDRPSLPCDRISPWGFFDGNVASSELHQVVLVGGSHAQDVDHFIERIRRCLRQPPERDVRPVQWTDVPAGKEPLLDALAHSLGGNLTTLPTALARALMFSNLVLIHPCVVGDFSASDLPQYYTEWLPELLRTIGPKHRLKCIQPIQWPGPARWSAPLKIARYRALRRDAQDLMRSIEGARAGDSGFEVTRVPELQDFDDDAVKEFCRAAGLREKGEEYLLDQVGLVPRTPREIFRAIDMHFSAAKGHDVKRDATRVDAVQR